MTAILTVGHGARPIEEFIELLRPTGAGRVVDVRWSPTSSKHPHFGGGRLAASLRDAGMAYEWRRELGGWRRVRPDSRHVAIRSPGFRGYADHMESDEFRKTLRWLIETSEETPTTVMCAESLWWRCHRSLLADSLVAAESRVCHIMPDGTTSEHRLHRWARVEGGVVVYDGTS